MDINQTLAELEKEVTLPESMVKLLPELVHLIHGQFYRGTPSIKHPNETYFAGSPAFSLLHSLLVAD